MKSPSGQAALALGAALGLTAITASPATAASLRVTPSSGLPASGTATVAVSGSGFDATGNNGVGIYVVFGPRRANFHLDANAFAAAKWVHTGGSGGGQAALAKDGSFSTTLTVKAKFTDGNGVEVDCRTTPCYIITMAAHGSSDRSQDTFTRLTFKGTTATAAPSSPSPSTAAASPSKTPKPSKTTASAAPAREPSAAPATAEEQVAVQTVSSSDAAPAWPFWTAVAATVVTGFAARTFTRRRLARR